jgi:threonine/homoserine/homoserine lactone efflux protein
VNITSFKQGFLNNILNPKTAVLFLSFFPPFVDSASNSFLPFLIMGATYTLMTPLWSVLFCPLNKSNQYFFMKKPKTQKVIEGL